MAQKYLVQVVPNRYFASWCPQRKPTPLCVRAMSLAKQFSYRDADHLCVFLREEGFPIVAICDIFGTLITHDAVKCSTEPPKKYMRYPRTRSEYRGLERHIAPDLLDLWKRQDLVFAAAVNKFERHHAKKTKAPAAPRKKVRRAK